MTRCSRAATVAVLSLLWSGVSASAESMRCQSVNGNLNCAGSGAVSCQTVNGQTVCVSGHGGVIQSFGKTTPPAPDGARDGPDDGARNGARNGPDDGPDDGADDPDAAPPARLRLERHDFHGRTLLLERAGPQLHLRTDWLSVDRD